ncbi:MAG: hypothetical protein QOH08_1179 [Chloroflexota bacterium]|nr:hypothetical protein [Chloroflexota bacterium]
MTGENDKGRKTAREEFEEARQRYYAMRQRERDMRQQEREREREAHRDERNRTREERRSLRDEIRRSVNEGLGHGFGKHLGQTIKESMSFNVDLGDLDFGGEEYSETVERDFAVGPLPGLHVRNVSGDTKISVGEDGKIHVTARKRVRGTSEERAKRLLENVEVRMEQEGSDVLLKPHLYEQDRGWADLFRGGRVAVDFEITVPREVRLEAHTVSGDITLAGTRGPMDIQSVSGELVIGDVQGPMRLKTVSGDAAVTEFAGQLVANTVSGDLTFKSVRLHGSDIVTVSGDVRIDGELDKDREHRMKTISGDVDLHLTGGSYDVRFSSMSGDLDSEMDGEISHEGKRAKRIVIGAAETQVSVKTMSGDLEIRASGGTAPASSAAATTDHPEDVERTEPMEPARPAEPEVDVRDLLERVARGEVDVAAAAAALDARRER